MVKKEKTMLWEILIPAHSNQGVDFSIEHHKKWDELARKLSHGMTILKTAKGQWINPDGKMFHDKMIPIRLHCTESDIDKIIKFTLKHYDQEAVMAYMISSNVKIVYKQTFKTRN